LIGYADQIARGGTCFLSALAKLMGSLAPQVAGQSAAGG